MNKIKILIFLLLGTILSSCEDPFGFTKKNIKDCYYIQDFDLGLFFILEKADGEYENIFEGNIEQIALVNNKIYAKINKSYSGDKDGVYVLDMEKITYMVPWTKFQKN